MYSIKQGQSLKDLSQYSSEFSADSVAFQDINHQCCYYY